MTIEYNLITGCGAHWITVSGDNPPSTIRFNTLTDVDGTIICANKSSANGGPTAASRTNIYNNIVRNIALTGERDDVPSDPQRSQLLDRGDVRGRRDPDDLRGLLRRLGRRR
jgi:hypothetical protein